ncbi:MAG: hypothetical protein KGL35_00905 [Bradyrhizobium sp.]|nr:hypothetical protein [Bradyrhizobium sp.]
MSASPTQRSLSHLRGLGYVCWIVEHWNHFTRRRQDLFGAWDILALREGEVLFVQTTSGSNVSARIRKIADNEYTPTIRKAGVRLEVHGWRKGANGRWALRTVDVS